MVSGDANDLVSERLFDAPRDRVYEAFSDPLQLARWWGPTGFTNTFDAFDLRPGGAWRFVMHAPDGSDHAMAKEFVEVAPQERVVLRHLDPPQHRFLMTIRFDDHGQRTLVTWHMRFEIAEEAERIRVFVLEANEQNFDRLAAHLGESRGHT